MVQCYSLWVRNGVTRTWTRTQTQADTNKPPIQASHKTFSMLKCYILVLRNSSQPEHTCHSFYYNLTEPRMDMTRYPLELLDFSIVCQFYITFPCIYYHRPEHRSITTQNHAHIETSYDSYKVSNFSGHYLCNRSTLNIGVLGYIGIV
jgi:hypothetical protein